MIVKSMARKSAGFAQLLRYLDKPGETITAFLHNFRTSPAEQVNVLGQFRENARYLPPRKGGNILYHEVLSFSKDSAPFLTVPMIEDLAGRYLDMRAPYALAYAKVHAQSACPHVHLVLSANDLESEKRIRVSKADFGRIKKQLERYQRERYPLLVHSLAQEKRTRRRPPKGREAPVKSMEGTDRLEGMVPVLEERRQKIERVEGIRTALALRDGGFRERLRVLLALPEKGMGMLAERWKGIIRALRAKSLQRDDHLMPGGTREP